MPNQNIHAGHRARKRQFVLKHGIADLPLHEVLEVLLYSAMPRRDTNGAAHILAERYDSLSAVLDAPYRELAAHLTENTAFLLKFVRDIACEYALQKGRADYNGSPTTDTLKEYVETLFFADGVEQVYAIFFDRKRHIKASRQLSTAGDFGSCMFSATEIAEFAAEYNSTNIIITHNHPLAAKAPSTNDFLITKKLSAELRKSGLILLDHFVVGTDGVCSFKEEYKEFVF
ncbi:MAG: hypothetical protein LBN42_00350 [Oscillospiraceae bacterium]|jgi:DNA repair protein RadC|nr:hypothetical protein [Oscillospiraceae bacterium]